MNVPLVPQSFLQCSVYTECSLTIWWQVITPVSVLITAQSRGGRVTRDSGQARDNHCDAETELRVSLPERLQLESH